MTERDKRERATERREKGSAHLPVAMTGAAAWTAMAVKGDLCTSNVLNVRIERRSQNLTTPRTDAVMTSGTRE